jgi:hypothetical protein
MREDATMWQLGRTSKGRALRAMTVAAAIAIAGCGSDNDDFLLVGGTGTGAGDTTPPTVVSTTPVTGSTNVPTNSPISVTFSENVDSASVTNAAFTLSGGATGTIVVSGAVATLTPTTPMAANSIITATVSTAVRDRAGNPLASPVSWSFTTAP